MEVVAGIAALVAGGAVADLEIDDVARRPVDQMMRDARRREARAHARREVDLARVGDERRRAFQNIDELVLLRVSMQQRGLASGQKPRQVHAEVLQAEDVAERPLLAVRHAAEEGLGIVRRLGA